MEKIIEFKYHNLQLEFLSPSLDSRLQILVYALAGFVYFTLGKVLLITEIFRLQEMQDEYYKDDPVYKVKPFKSVHQVWRGVDISLKYFTDEEVKSIEKFLNSNFIYTSESNTIKTALVHDMGYGWHLHIQVDSDNFTSIIKTN